MIAITKFKTLTAATLIVAGCATSDYLVPRTERSTWKPVQDARMADAKDVPSPKILPETHFAAGFLFEGQGQYEKAILQYRKAIAVSHDYVEAYHRLGLMLSKVGRHAEAIEAFRRAVELKPNWVVYHHNLGFELMLRNQWVEAERELRKTIELSPKFDRAHVNLGVVLSRQGRFEEALDAFLQVLPDSDAYYNLGLMFRGQKRYDEAAEAFERVLVLDPQFTAASSQLEQILPFREAVESTPLTANTDTTDETITTVSVVTTDSDLTTVRAHTPTSTEPVVFDPYQSRFVASTDSIERLASYDTNQSKDIAIADMVPVTSVASDWYTDERWWLPEWDRTVREIDFDAEIRAAFPTDSDEETTIVEPVSAFTGESIDDNSAVTDEAEAPSPHASIDAFEFFNNGFRIPAETNSSSDEDSNRLTMDLQRATLVASNEMSCWDDLISQAFARNQPSQSINPDVFVGWDFSIGHEFECLATEESTWEDVDDIEPAIRTGTQGRSYGFPREQLRD